MTNKEIKQLETELWGSADNLRANSKLTAAEYKGPVLGLILLRYAQNKFEEAKKQIENDFLDAGAMYLQEKSQFDYLAKYTEPKAQDRFTGGLRCKTTCCAKQTGGL